MTASRATILYVGTLCLAYALLPSLTFPNPPLDVVEGFAWGRELQLGYTKHPPMQAWLLEFTYWLTGTYAGGYWLSAVSVAAGFWFIWLLAADIGLTGRQRFWSLVLTSVTFYFTLPLPEFNPNILQIPIWAGMIFLFHRAISTGRLWFWLSLGALAAFGLYTKYFVALLIGAIGLYALVFPHARRHLATAGPYLCAAVCLVLLIPHVGWLLKTDLLTLQYAASRSKSAASFLDHIYNPLNFLMAQIGNHAGLFVVVLAGLGWSGLKALKRGIAPRTNLGQRNSDDRFLLWFAFLPLGVVVLASAVTGNEFEHMWGTPMFVLSGIVAVRFISLPQRWPFERRALAAAIGIQTVFLGVLFGQAVLEPLWKTKHTRLHYPAQAVAADLEEIWQDAVGTDLYYVAGDMWSAANVTLHADGRPSMFYLHDTNLSPWIDLKDVQEKGVMLVWRGDREQPLEPILRFYPEAKRNGFKTYPSHLYGTIPDVTVNWAIIRPGQVAEVAKSK
ncbi:glycosyltransferase family 39 protein [Roseibium denhamense]|uniref:Dolichyl-phosphate-mannose-protein mannosyltransferase n=1 Tax=Roseibium denhamense TaxID=76305 RepID=A0ABY1P7T9_9HYPH|nr:glycosyltransferase family 39 protein [Roseibium denhamense]MTI04529.1 glycosyltransferase family 39 protein [Roseibium denhamense]SMP28306.1 Dolichyl-phosphate-mannose-protein mannosyltransferase [Roseibium denhamense]